LNSFEYTNLLKNIDIEDELNKRGIEYKKSGKNLIFCCMFHHEKNPSAGVVFQDYWKNGKYIKGNFGCMGCSEKKDWFNFIAYLDNISRDEAISLYDGTEQQSLDKIKKTLEIKFKPKKKLDDLKVLDFSYLDQFTKPYGEYLEYLYFRGLNDESIKNWKILCSDEGYYKKRIIIPIIFQNELISVTARSIDKNISKYEKVRKTKNSDVSRIVFGLDDEIKDKCVIVEGEIDMIILRQRGIPAVQSTKNPSDEQISIICSKVEEVYVCLDGDVYIKERDMKHIMELKNKFKEFVKTIEIKLPKDKDPASLSFEETKKIFSKFFL
jgi:DNA primase